MRYFTIILFLFTTTINMVWGQPDDPNILIEECGTYLEFDEEEYADYMNRTKEIRENVVIEDYRIPQIPIQVHVIIENEGTIEAPSFEGCPATWDLVEGVGYTTTDTPCNMEEIEEHIEESINQANALFSANGIQLAMCNEINYIADDAYPDHNLYPWFTQIGIATLNPHPATGRPHVNVDDAINIYYSPYYQYCGQGTFPYMQERYFYQNYVLMNNKCATNGSTLAHEIGHYLNLKHTFHGSVYGGDNIDELADESNCGMPSVGDELCDTPADHQNRAIYDVDGNLVSAESEVKDYWTTSSGFLIVDNTLAASGLAPCCAHRENDGEFLPFVPYDEFGNAYDVSNLVTTNIMSYSWSNCRSYFSPQQIGRMVKSLIVDRPVLLNNSNCAAQCPVYSTIPAITLPNPVEVYIVSDYISSQGTVPATNTFALLDAGKKIFLNPPFEAEYGSTFCAQIDGCEPLTLKESNLKSKSPSSGIVIQPNPFKDQCEIVFELAKNNSVTITVSDIMGKKVSTLLNNEQRIAGKQQVNFDGSDLPAGIYYCTVQTGDKIETQKMVIAK